MSLAVMNILTGLIVQNIETICTKDEQTACLAYRRKHMQAVEDVRELFAALDANKDGRITIDEYMSSCHDYKVLVLLDHLDLNERDAEHFFRMMLSLSHVDTVDIEQFLQGVVQLRGAASSIDAQPACALFADPRYA